MDKLKMHSPNLTDENIAKILELFPSCVTEAKDENGELRYAVDFDQLRQELSDHIVEGPTERYQINWPGKREALLASSAPIAKTLRPSRKDSVSFDSTENLFIEGDNLEALKLIQEIYLGKIKLIYIDPPYNTGNDFIYDDDFSECAEDFLKKSLQKDDAGNRLTVNVESNGRFHSEWMTMMYPRLRLAKNIMSDDGVLLVSIGPEELKNLQGLVGEIFGESNRLSLLTWEKGRKNDSTFFSDSAEYMLVYSKNKEFLSNLGKWREKKDGIDSILDTYHTLRCELNDDHAEIEIGMRKYYADLEEDDSRKKLSHFYRSDDRGLFFGADISSASTSIPDYEIIHPTTNKPVKKPSRGWGATEPVMLERIKNNEVLFGPDESTIPLKKSYLKDVDSIVKTPVFYKDGRAASGILKSLFGEVIFNNPKDHIILSDIISYCLQGHNDATVVDFFAGSSSTAHAVMELNANDGGSRKFIMIQVPEELSPESATSPAAKQTILRAIKFLQSLDKPLNIAEISKERIRRSGQKILAENPEAPEGLDTGFRVLKVDTSNMADTYYAPEQTDQAKLLDAVDNIKPDRTDPEDLLFQVLVDWGVDLTLPIRKETVQGKVVFFVSNEPYDLIACFDHGVTEELVKELAKHEPMRAVFRDNGFVSDAVKINVEQIFKQLSPTTDVKAI